ncbi:MAG: MarR family transcriptional regulator [Comamonas sp.]|nr:MarR family transcriptional regulator [Comamonas sp.]
MSLAHPTTVDEFLNYRLNRLLAASGAMTVLLCEGRYGISRREWRLIAMLAAHGPLSPTELAEHANLERARVSRHIATLVDRQLIRRFKVDADGRRAKVELAPAGQALYQALFPESVRFNQQVLSVLSEAEIASFESTLSKLTQQAERIAAQRPIAEKADRRHGGSKRLSHQLGVAKPAGS